MNEEDTSAVFQKFLDVKGAQLKAAKQMNEHKKRPTIVEYWADLEDYYPRVGVRLSEAQISHIKRVNEHPFAKMSGRFIFPGFSLLKTCCRNDRRGKLSCGVVQNVQLSQDCGSWDFFGVYDFGACGSNAGCTHYNA